MLRIAVLSKGRLYDETMELLKEAGIKLTTLSNYDALLEVALDTDFIGEDDIETLKQWRKDPASWAPHRDTTIE